MVVRHLFFTYGDPVKRQSLHLSPQVVRKQRLYVCSWIQLLNHK